MCLGCLRTSNISGGHTRGEAGILAACAAASGINVAARAVPSPGTVAVSRRLRGGPPSHQHQAPTAPSCWEAPSFRFVLAAVGAACHVAAAIEMVR